MEQVHHYHNYKAKYIRGIDGLRALAVLSVLLFHLDSSLLPGGFTGVDIFFVISGYVVSSSLSRDTSLNFTNFILSFYARRFLRILPALIVCLGVTTLFVNLFVPDSWLSNTISKTGLAAFYGFSNFALIWHSDDYFSPRTDFNPFVHTWSLGVEEQFYLVFPFLFYVWLKYRRNGSTIGLAANTVLIIILFLSLLYSWYETNNNQQRAFYLLPSRFWELAAGAILFKLHSQNRLLPKSLFKHRAFLLIGLLFVSAGFLFAEEDLFPFPWALLPVIGALFLISGVIYSHHTQPIIQHFFENSIVVYLGKISYSLYLWHWPVYVLLRWTIGLEVIEHIILAITLTFFLAAVSYHYIEKPIRKSSYLLNRKNWEVVLIGIFIVLAALLAAKAGFMGQRFLSQSVTKDKVTWYPSGWSSENKAINTALFEGKKLLVIGDSHAGAYRTMIQKLSDEYGAEIKIKSKGGCAVANLLSPNFNESSKCPYNLQDEIDFIENNSSSGDIIFLASLRMNRIGNQWGPYSEEKIFEAQYSEEAIEKRKLAYEEAVEFINRFSKLGRYIIIDAPKPIYKSPPFRCSDWFNSNNPHCAGGFEVTRDFLLSHREPVMQGLTQLKQRFPEIIIWDPFPLLCDSPTCRAFDENGKPLFFDGDHLSGHGNRVLYPDFLSTIKSIWSD